MRPGLNLAVLLAALALLVGCGPNDVALVDDALNADPFFQALGAIPPARVSYVGPLTPGDTSRPVAAWRVIPEPEIDYAILTARPFAAANIQLVWPCTLFVVYPGQPDTTTRDTVAKPAPELLGLMQAKFGLIDESWQMIELSPCDARSDSGFRHLEIESLQVSVRRGGDSIGYPTLKNARPRPLEEYDYAFRTGDSICLRLWQSDSVQYPTEMPWCFLHGVDGDAWSEFGYDSTSRCWQATWVTLAPGHHWVWLELLDLSDALLSRLGPDRNVFWGLAYTVE